MNLYYTYKNNQLQPVWMGCYGIGLERCMAAVVEQHHDEAGIIWPEEIAPFKVAIVQISDKDENQCKVASEMYDYCISKGYDVLYDDRKERPGVKFKDMELIGIPYRFTVGRKASEGIVEFVSRYDNEKKEMTIPEALQFLDEKYK